MLAQTLLGSRIRDLRSVVQYLRTRRDVDPQRIGLWGESLAAVNPPDDNLAVPQDADRQPRLAEPMGALAAMFAALFDDGIRAVAARGGLVSYLSLLESPFCYVPHDVIVPSALTAGDLCDVAAALAPRPLLLDSPVNGQNQRVRLDPSPRPFLVVSQSYREADSAARLTLGLERNDGPALADWLKSALTSP
jgi:hypothetical protein